MNVESKKFVFSNQIEWEVVGEGVRRQILGYNDNLMQVAVEFQTGAIGAEHSHVHSQTCYVVSGVFEFKVGDETHIVRAGDGLYMEPNIPHGVKCVESGILLDSFNPVRTDFLS